MALELFDRINIHLHHTIYTQKLIYLCLFPNKLHFINVARCKNVIHIFRWWNPKDRIANGSLFAEQVVLGEVAIPVVEIPVALPCMKNCLIGLTTPFIATTTSLKTNSVSLVKRYLVEHVLDRLLHNPCHIDRDSNDWIDGPNH